MNGTRASIDNLSYTEVVVKVMDKPFTITCPNDKVQALQDSAAYVDAEMRKIREAGKVVGSDQIAVLVALNVAYELLSGQDVSKTVSTSLVRKLDNLEANLTEALAKVDQSSHTN